MLNRKVHKEAVLCMDGSVARSLTTGSLDKQLRLFDTRGICIHVYLLGDVCITKYMYLQMYGCACT